MRFGTSAHGALELKQVALIRCVVGIGEAMMYKRSMKTITAPSIAKFFPTPKTARDGTWL
jgi:hypothetical protein